jgi:hypothetical protein
MNLSILTSPGGSGSRTRSGGMNLSPKTIVDGALVQARQNSIGITEA